VSCTPRSPPSGQGVAADFPTRGDAFYSGLRGRVAQDQLNGVSGGLPAFLCPVS
jgi:hypothetical protein